MSKTSLKNDETRKAINALLDKVDNGNAHFGKSDESNQIACNRLYGDTPATRCEFWVKPTRIDVYVGKFTPMFKRACEIVKHDNSTSNMNVKHSKNELCIKFTTLEAVSDFINEFIVKEKTTKKSMTKNTTKKDKAVKSA